MSFIQRTHSCGELRSKDAGRNVVLNGWAHRVRDLGGVCFVDMRDRTGLIQLMFDPTAFKTLSELRSECCLSVSGEVRLRSEAAKNANLPTGDIELVVTSYSILSPAKPIPFPISDEEQMKTVNEELRIKHRYLDLRRPAMYRKLAIRAAAIAKIRRYLDERDFLEVETPIITKSTPEGARDYLVPYRLQPGKFYALPQSPQQYKQLLMVSGIERYYQIAKCFRDESQRSDRQPEFTQLDIEMSFIKQEDVLHLIEGLTRSVVNELIEEFDLDKCPIAEFPRLTYDESINLYGTDKPDVRFDLRLFDVTSVAGACDFGVFRSTVEAGGMVRGVRYPGGAELSRKEIGELEALAKEFGAKGLATMAVTSGSAEEGVIATQSGFGVRGSIAKFFKPAELDEILKLSQAEAGDLLCFIADGYAAGNNVLSRLRNEIGGRAGLRDPKKLLFCWVLDFPLVEWDATTNHWSPMHHLFTAPKDEDLIYIDSEPARIRADCYDIVCNGMEWASGSIRIHRPDVQARIFTLIGLDEKTQQERFGHMLEAFSFGAPPHGGIAPGIDRMVMLLTDDENIREVMAFPKVGNGYDPLMEAPDTIDPQQWAELGIRLTAPVAGVDAKPVG
jgi:aspartyl-tRNA synthetase